VRKTSARTLAITCARVANEKKAKEIRVLDLRRFLYVTDFFVIASGRNRRQLQSITDEIREILPKRKFILLSLEGYKEGSWILLDCGDVVVHLFLDETRAYYDLEMLWGDVPRVRWQKPPRRSKP